ncbi:MAG: helix-turn-helix domain-containing protein [Actinomycetes bacterium]
MLTTVVATYRQKVLWLTPLPGGSVNAVMDSEESRFKRTLGATILELRAHAAIPSQRALAKLVGVSEATVRRWEAGDGCPDAWEVNRLCVVLGCEPDDLIRPAEMTERERELLRRSARQVHRTLDRERGAS